MKLCFVSLVLFLGLGPGVSFAKTAAQELEGRLSWFKTTSGQSSEFDKTVYQELQGRTEASEGVLSVREGSLKIAIKEPNETLLVVNKDALWLETKMGEDFPVSVQKIKRKSLKSGASVWNVLTGKESLSTHFMVLRKAGSKDNGFELKPRNAKTSDIASIEFLFVGTKLKKMAYTDELENVVTYNFENWKPAKLTPKDFNYKPPQNSEVTEL